MHILNRGLIVLAERLMNFVCATLYPSRAIFLLLSSFAHAASGLEPVRSEHIVKYSFLIMQVGYL